MQPFREAGNLLAMTLQNALGPVAKQAADALGAVLPAAMEGASGVLRASWCRRSRRSRASRPMPWCPPWPEFGKFLQTEAVPAPRSSRDGP
ncbi:MAG: hypothetical protein ACLTDR_11755 [Adlercreutzia equolifaciens]